MIKGKTKGIKKITAYWNKRAKRYDEYYKNFKGAVEQYIDLYLLKRYLPKKKDARILDTAGGTGRITLSLLEMGYLVTLCDISSGMLRVAREKIQKRGLLNQVKIFGCDACDMPFPDGTFDFVICYGVEMKALKELSRVTKRNGIISMCIANNLGNAISKFREEPKRALALLESASDREFGKNEKYCVVTERNLEKILKVQRINIIAIYAGDIWNLLAIPEKILDSHAWKKRFFRQTVEMMLKLSENPFVRGVSRRWVLYGERM